MKVLIEKLKELNVEVSFETKEYEDEIAFFNLTFPDGTNVQVSSGAEGGEESWIEVNRT